MYDWLGHSPENPRDILVIGGGVAGCGFARDAAGRGLSVVLAEAGDLGAAGSGATMGLLHGGFDEALAFRPRKLRDGLYEREELLRTMPHIVRPLRVVLPFKKPRFRSPMFGTTRLRIASWLYDLMSLRWRKTLSRTRWVSLLLDRAAAAPLKRRYRKAYTHEDAWVDDGRLLALLARDAARRGADIWTRARVVQARRLKTCWHVTAHDRLTGAHKSIYVRMLVNAAGAQACQVLSDIAHVSDVPEVRLTRGASIVTRKLFDHDDAYQFQTDDGRFVFAMPYGRDFTLIGAWDIEVHDPKEPVICTQEDRAYLCDAASMYLETPINEDDVLRSAAGVRVSPVLSRSHGHWGVHDYGLHLDGGEELAPILTLFGGSLTTHRAMTEAAIDYVRPLLHDPKGYWTSRYALPGGDLPAGGLDGLLDRILREHAFLNRRWAERLVRSYGADVLEMLEYRERIEDMGLSFGADLTEVEVRWLVTHEFARQADDILWRRTRLGLHMNEAQIAAFTEWFEQAMRTPARLVPKARSRLLAAAE